MDLSTVSDAVMGGAAVPVYRLMQGNKDITGRFQGRLISLTLTDNRGFEADQLDIELDDADGALSLPDKGATLSLGIGWQDTGVVDKGRYKVDELEHSGPPDRLTIRARSVDLAGGMTLRKERSFRGQTIGAIVGAIASKNALAAIVASALAGLVIDHIDQTSESDANFLTRLAKDHDAIATVKQGSCCSSRRGCTERLWHCIAHRRDHARKRRYPQLPDRRSRELQRGQGVLSRRAAGGEGRSRY